jgi:hypothetical protein
MEIHSLNLLEESIGLLLIPLVSYVLKIFLKPSKTEVKIIAQLIMLLVSVTIRILRKRKDSESESHLINIREELSIFRSKLKKDKVALG